MSEIELDQQDRLEHEQRKAESAAETRLPASRTRREAKFWKARCEAARADCDALKTALVELDAAWSAYARDGSPAAEVASWPRVETAQGVMMGLLDRSWNSTQETKCPTCGGTGRLPVGDEPMDQVWLGCPDCSTQETK